MTKERKIKETETETVNDSSRETRAARGVIVKIVTFELPATHQTSESVHPSHRLLYR